jgi:hypothetical protein
VKYRILASTAAVTTAALASLVGPAAAAQAAPPCVQKISVVNNAGFVASFRVTTPAGVETPSTDEYPIDQWRTIDLTPTGIPENTSVRPIVHAVAGVDNPGNTWVTYCANGQTATYSVTGTTQNFTVTLLT